MRSNSVSAPIITACNTPEFYYSPASPLPSLSSLIGRSLAEEHLINPHIKTVLQLCLLYGCRIKELLSTTKADVFPIDRLFIKAEKGSRSYFIFLPGISEQISKFPGLPESAPLFPFNYMRVYRVAVRIGLYCFFAGSKNRSVTHLGRHILAQSVNRLAGEKAASDALRHRADRSIQYYLKEVKK